MSLKCIFLSFLVTFAFGDHNSTDIVGGKNAKLRKFPFAASLRFEDGHMCGASILNDQFLLTAAHCVCENSKPKDTAPYSIQYGLTNITSDRVNVVNVKTIYCNAFNSTELVCDSAILELESPMPKGDWEPVKLSKDFFYQNQTKGTIIGWNGIMESGYEIGTLQKLDVTIYDNDFCKTKFIQKHQICLGSKGGACRGESGNALLVDGVQVGIASFITDTCGVANKDNPTVYARVAAYHDWISRTAGLEIN